MRASLAFQLLLFYCITCHSQSLLQSSQSESEKPAIDSAAIVNWPWLGSMQAISNDGKYLIYRVENQPLGERTLVVQSIQNRWKKELININNAFFSSDSRQLIFQSTDTLFFLTLGTDHFTTVVGVSSYKHIIENDDWLVYLANKERKELVLLNLRTGGEKRFQSVTDYTFVPRGNALLFQSTNQNSSIHRLHWLSFSNLISQTIWLSQKPTNDPLNINSYQFDDTGKQLVFITNDTTIWYYKVGMKKAVPKLSNGSIDTSQGLILSNQSPSFSKKGQYIFFQLQKKLQDQRKPDPNAVQVDIWSYRDSLLPFEQSPYPLHPLYLAALPINGNNFVQLQSENEVVMGDNGDFLLIQDRADIPTDIFWWPSYTEKSYWLVNLKNGLRKRLATVYDWSNITFSPDNKYLVYYDHLQQHYYSYQLSSGIIKNISHDLNSTLFDQRKEVYPLGDTPHDMQYIQGWIPSQHAVLVSDDYDIWQFDLEGKKRPINLTNGFGRSQQIKFQLIDPRFPTNYFPINTSVLLYAFNVKNKYSGFYRLTIGKVSDPVFLSMEPSLINLPIKALDTNIWIVPKETATSALNYYVSQDLITYRKITNIEPQKAYNWLTTELITWRQLDSSTTQGVLYKPENFDPNKKYPLLFYYYEQLSQDMYKFQRPTFSIGIIDIAWYVSRGYLVFTPDIHYGVASVTGKVNGDYAVNTIVSAAQYLSGLPYVDSQKMGIQGHSFGGGETLYIVTHSNLFAAACAGAATVSNEITAYLGIVREHGKPVASKMLNSEAGHNKIGATLWQRPDLYIQASPVFRADKVTTPLLLMHNLGDGICDWIQSAEMFMALRRLGKKVWLLQYDHGTHIITPGKDAIDYTVRMQQFFDHYLKGAPAPKWMTRGIRKCEKGIETGLDLDQSSEL